ncbi:ATP-binding cassette domain-containing protein [Bifidobacterium vespertilionis]|nr:ATP-binding cassette domain-containing protein [Bifidobacterium vespertilionis]
MMNVLETRALGKRYAGKYAVDHLDMHVPQGAIYGFVGRNGAGKSTVMKMAAGLVAPSEGEVRLFGEPFVLGGHGSGHGAAGHARRLGVLIENPGILPTMSAMDNLVALCLAVGDPSPRKTAADLLDVVGLAHTGRKAAKGFSLGMKQRLGLAMALVNSPDLLLLDEPLNGLDPEGARAIRTMLVKLNETRGVTIVISSHVLDQLERMCTHYGVIASGRMVREMTAREVAEECGNSIRVRTADTSVALVLLQDRNLPGVRYAAESDGSIIISGDAKPEAIARMLHDDGQTVLELAVQSNDMEDYFVHLMGSDETQPEQPAQPHGGAR